MRSILDRVVTRQEAMADPDIMRTAQNLIAPEVEEIRVIDVDGLRMQSAVVPTSPRRGRWARCGS